MPSTTTAEGAAPNPTTATNNNPAPTSKPTTDAPAYTSDVSPPAYSDAAPTYDLAAPPSAPDSSSTTNTAADVANPPTTTSPPSASTPLNLEEGTELDATPIPFHFLIQSSSTSAPSADDPSSSSSPQASTTTTTKKITHIHPIPDILLGTAAPPASAQDLFVDVLSDALGAHQDECRAAAPRECDICGEEAATVLLTPVSFLHVDEDAPPAYDSNSNSSDGDDGGDRVPAPRLGKRVEVLVTPVCARDNCGVLARKRLRCAMEDTHNDHEHGERVTVRPPQGLGDVGCKVCGSEPEGGAKRCAGCGVVRYCGRECQRGDWRAGHKRVCATYAELVEDGRMEEVVGMEEVVRRAVGGGGGYAA
ncbi:Ubiquitin carboxyl-terminal hydrolase 18 [Diplodia seriata]|uniref:Ubiquitin carboxyl-terminal hydrolase 18 n=1 Tax=Diplodia seriata TaxID=420778 RepID=A0A1S8BBP2_9PEZI|nr:Ubiquitin carboxyl-terminal hydrolase 18 [Diplodia seriata]